MASPELPDLGIWSTLTAVNSTTIEDEITYRAVCNFDPFQAQQFDVFTLSIELYLSVGLVTAFRFHWALRTLATLFSRDILLKRVTSVQRL